MFPFGKKEPHLNRLRLVIPKDKNKVNRSLTPPLRLQTQPSRVPENKLPIRYPGKGLIKKVNAGEKKNVPKLIPPIVPSYTFEASPLRFPNQKEGTRPISNDSADLKQNILGLNNTCYLNPFTREPQLTTTANLKPKQKKISESEQLKINQRRQQYHAWKLKQKHPQKSTPQSMPSPIIHTTRSFPLPEKARQFLQGFQPMLLAFGKKYPGTTVKDALVYNTLMQMDELSEEYQAARDELIQEWEGFKVAVKSIDLDSIGTQDLKVLTQKLSQEEEIGQNE